MTSRIDVMEKSLEYCRDRGESFRIQAIDSDSWWGTKAQEIDHRFLDANLESDAECQLLARIEAVEDKINNKTTIIPPLALKQAFTPHLVDAVLKDWRVRSHHSDAERICTSFYRVLTILFKIGKANSIVEFLREGIDDSCLPLEWKEEKKRSTEYVQQAKRWNYAHGTGLTGRTSALGSGLSSRLSSQSEAGRLFIMNLSVKMSFHSSRKQTTETLRMGAIVDQKQRTRCKSGAKTQHLQGTAPSRGSRFIHGVGILVISK